MQPTANVSAIKPVTVQAPPVGVSQQFQIPLTQTLPLADGSGNTVEVVVNTITVTATQLTSQIANFNKQIANAQAQVASLQAQLNAINGLQTAQVTPVLSTPVVPVA